VFDREQHDQYTGNDHRHIVDAIGNRQHGFFLAPLGVGPQPAALHHEHPKHRHQRMDQQLHTTLPFFGQQHDQRFQTDVASVAHPHRQAKGGDKQHQQQGQVLGPGRRVVEDVAANDLPLHAKDHGDQTHHRQHQAEFGDRCTKSGEHEKLQPPALAGDIGSEKNHLVS